MSEFRLTVTPRTDQRATAAPSSGSSERSTSAAMSSGPVGSQTPALQCVMNVQPVLQCVMREPALQCVPRTPDAR